MLSPKSATLATKGRPSAPPLLFSKILRACREVCHDMGLGDIDVTFGRVDSNNAGVQMGRTGAQMALFDDIRQQV